MQLSTQTQPHGPSKSEPQVAPKREPQRVLSPPVDVYETTDALFIVSDLPGVLAADLTLVSENGTLSLSAERKTKGFVPLTFKRSFALPEDIDNEAIQAELKLGVLTVTLPRRASAKPRTIAIKSA